MTITTIDGLRLSGSSGQIVAELQRSAFVSSAGIEDYRKQVADRVLLVNSQTVRTDTDDNFLRDLQAAGMITELTEEQ
jgi:hypothetical protein